jgi:VanZ family protein
VPTAHWLELLSFDKFVHASIFFTFIFLWLLVGFKKNKLSLSFIIFIIIACIGYGGLLEIMQAKVFSERSGDWFDFIANSFGCLIGVWFFSKQKFRLLLIK